MLILPYKYDADISYSRNSVVVTATYRMSVDSYNKSDGDFFLYIRYKKDNCDFVCPTCGAAL